jgi:hypothetical protein
MYGSELKIKERYAIIIDRRVRVSSRRSTIAAGATVSAIEPFSWCKARRTPLASLVRAGQGMGMARS